MKWSIVILLVVGTIAAVSAAVLIASLRITGQTQLSQAPPSKPVDIVVAVRDIKPSRVVEAQDVTTKAVDKSDVHDAFTGTEGVIGRVLLVPAVQGQALNRTMFAPPGSGPHLAANLTPGMRVVTITLARDQALEGLLYPGCQVDVLAAFPLNNTTGNAQAVSTPLLRGVQVLSIDNRTVAAEPAMADKDAAGKPKTGADANQDPGRKVQVGLLVNSREAEALQLAMAQGSVLLALRGQTDTMPITEEGTVLNGGQLAKLSDVLRSTATAQVGAGGTGATPTTPTQPPPTTAHDPAATWDVTIFRGDKKETMPLEWPKGQPQR